MRKSKAIKDVVCFASAAFMLSAFSMTAHAEESASFEQSVAGISCSLENYVLASIDVEDDVLTNILMTDIISPYANLGVSKASSYVNVRKEPSTESEVVGKLYQGCAADILEYLEGDWVKIVSGDVSGYIASNYLAIGEEAETMVDEFADKSVTVTAQTLNVRAEQSTDSTILTQIPQGETYIVVKEYEGWVEVLLGTDDDTGKDFTGFVSKDFVSVNVEFQYAISIEEENRIKREQEEAERRAEEAEAERKQKLAEEKARKAEEERKAEEAKQEQQEEEEDDEDYDKPSSGSSGDVSSQQNDIITYALQFVGNSYQWGGESLTNGADCSGFVQTIYRDFGYYIPRVSSDQAQNAGRRVDISERQPGDLIFYTDSSGHVNHVAMYIGNNRIVHAANSRQGIITSQYNYRDVYRVRRIVN
jgi:cell wall-associated NlpC family hydrolase/uncharacterized protein YgiM (DUF1202 family)